MRLYIRQKGKRYQFYKNDSDKNFLIGFWESRWRKALCSKILDLNDEELVFISQTKIGTIWNFDATRYSVSIPSLNIEFEIKAMNAHKGHWNFSICDDIYDFYFHFGLKKSLFKNDVQVAKYDKGTVHFWNEDTGFIISNNDENELMLLAIFLAFDMGEAMDGDVNIDLGNLTGGVREYNSYWQPS